MRGQCKIVRRKAAFIGKQGLSNFSGISAETAGSEALCLHLLEMPPAAEAKPHFHKAHETAIFVLEGEVEFRHGRRLETLDRAAAGDFVYIPAGMPHQPFNRTSLTAKAIIARTDPNEQEGVVLYDLEHLS